MPQATARSITLNNILFALLATCGVSTNASQAATSEAGTGIAGSAAAPAYEGAKPVNIRITIGAKNLVATLEDNQTARDFAALLPLTVTLRDFSAAEKVSDALPKRLSEEGAPATDAGAGAVGDIAYFAPWGNIAFYRGQGPDASASSRLRKSLLA